MIIEALLFGFILGKLRKGKIKNLDSLKFKRQGVFLALVLFDFLLRLFIVRSDSEISYKLFDIYPRIAIVFYLFLIIFLEINKDIKFLRWVEAGFILNFLAILMNGGKMPVSSQALLRIGELSKLELLRSNLVLTHKLLGPESRFWILSDIIPYDLFINKVVSLGDIISSIGILALIVHYMKRRPTDK